MEQQGRDGVRDRRGLRAKDLVARYLDTTDLKFTCKLRRIAYIDFIEKYRIVGGDVIVDPFLMLLEPVFGNISGLTSIRDDPDIALGEFADKILGGLVQLH